MVWQLLEDRTGTLWIGTLGGGLRHLAANELRTWGVEEGLASGLVTSIHEDGAGRLLVTTRNAGLSIFENGRFAAVPGVPDQDLWGGWSDPKNGDLWIGTSGSGLLRRRGGSLGEVDRGRWPGPGRGFRGVRHPRRRHLGGHQRRALALPGRQDHQLHDPRRARRQRDPRPRRRPPRPALGGLERRPFAAPAGRPLPHLRRRRSFPRGGGGRHPARCGRRRACGWAPWAPACCASSPKAASFSTTRCSDGLVDRRHRLPGRRRHRPPLDGHLGRPGAGGARGELEARRHDPRAAVHSWLFDRRHGLRGTVWTQSVGGCATRDGRLFFATRGGLVEVDPRRLAVRAEPAGQGRAGLERGPAVALRRAALAARRPARAAVSRRLSSTFPRPSGCATGCRASTASGASPSGERAADLPRGAARPIHLRGRDQRRGRPLLGRPGAGAGRGRGRASPGPLLFAGAALALLTLAVAVFQSCGCASWCAAKRSSSSRSSGRSPS